MPPDKGFTEESLVTDEGQCWICPSCRFVLFYVEVRVPSKTVSLEPSQQLLVTISVFPSPVPIPVRCLSTARVLPWTSPAYWGHWRLRWSGRAWLLVVCAHRDSKDRRNPGPKYGWLVFVSRPRLPGKVDHLCPVRLLFWTDYILPVPLCLRRICWWRRPSQDSSSVRAKLEKFSEEISWQTCWCKGDSVHTDPCAIPGPVCGRHYSVKIQYTTMIIFSLSSLIYNLTQ